MTPAALVTGGAKRIGLAIATALAERGYDIALHYRSSREEAERAAETIRRSGRSCGIFPCDFNRTEEVLNLVPRVFERFPGCRILVNSASIFERGFLKDTTEDLFDRHLRVNLKAPLFLTRAFAAQGSSGLVVNLCDAKITGELTAYFAYSLTKKALHAFTLMAAKELGPRIRVNAVAPGMILPSTEHSEDDLVRMSKKLPLRRKGDVRYVVSAVLYLLDNDYVTGECLFVDGGEHIR